MHVCVCFRGRLMETADSSSSATRGRQENKPALWARINPSPAFICIHVSSKYIPLYSTDRDITVKKHARERPQAKEDGCRKGMKHRIKEQIRTDLATEIVNLADMVLIRERRLRVRNAARKDFDTYHSVEEEREEWLYVERRRRMWPGS